MIPINVAHVFVWHYYLIQPIAAVVLVLFVFWIMYGIFSKKAKQKGHDKGFQEGYDFGFKAAQRKFDKKQ